MEKWLAAALDYVPRWLEFQMRFPTAPPGCSVAIAHKGALVLETALGHADLPRGVKLTKRHRFRVASHSKSFTAAGLMLLRERGKLQLEDKVGRHVPGLPRGIAALRLSQLLSHSAGLVRDGTVGEQWQNRRPFGSAAEVLADVSGGPAITPNTRFKYSNHGFALLGMAIEAITGERYGDWIAREVVAASGLRNTLPDAPIPRGVPFARGHSGFLPLGKRVAMAGDNVTGDMAAATGFVSTASDLAGFFSSLAPDARDSVLSVESRREMTRRHWRDSYSAVERWYGLGLIQGAVGDWEHFGHSGSFPGYISRTAVFPAPQLAISVVTNGPESHAHLWLEGIAHLVRMFQREGAPSRAASAWNGRWWGLWGALDLVPAGRKVFVTAPALFNPLVEASELAPQPGRRDGVVRARIVQASGLGSYGEEALLEHDARGRATAFQLGAIRLHPEARAKAELLSRYGRGR